jgi:hypothetical protein
VLTTVIRREVTSIPIQQLVPNRFRRHSCNHLQLGGRGCEIWIRLFRKHMASSVHDHRSVCCVGRMVIRQRTLFYHRHRVFRFRSCCST